jgi:PHD/YefM family antitoxin component YafN of YafNO toxin-antitoxin module
MQVLFYRVDVESGCIREYSRLMTRAISQEEFVESASDLVQVVGQQTVFIEKDGKPVAAIVSIAEYESTREAKAERAIAAMWAFREQMQASATTEELEELERALDRKAS